ncbi:PLP-dependent aminotransferase family protein [Chitinophaga pendula]|uniref:aminotransferase-like domain-containing protein n=1 Tax=Chitinophaga TaxID=79328 RepID=UPI000BAF02BC|nr:MULTISPECIES: PLP-dependent aminotransferase family protein [Chitinophaga]ASZ13916.1 GntR family transcriptional regulator [Chitinophaga sp. MD30]UCJ08466.1 PLP-dependent aminotransferase family protein [Chitinophaga pendula]
MNSPISFMLFAGITINHHTERAIYLQVADGILALIKSGKLGAGQKLPGSRDIANILHINRITAVKALEELQLQGWLASAVGKGTFVSTHISTHESAQPAALQPAHLHKKAGFVIRPIKYLRSIPDIPIPELHLDDGYPDPRLAPLKELHRAYRNQLNRGGLYQKFGSYGDPSGSAYYRQSISEHLHVTRGLTTTAANVLSVRGTLMAINLVCDALIAPGDVVVSAIPGWKRAEHNIIHAGAKHIGIAADEHGLVVDELKNICKRQSVRMVYITPHHHYPTTVPLRIDRRLELLRLANEYGFIILEDDYDFDFHYKHRPLFPLASADENGMVIYCGSFSKGFSPAFRIGYLVAAENVIEHLAKVRVLHDRQGDHILDNAIADIINDGTIQRYLRRTLPIYEQRRDLFCKLLREELRDSTQFTIPEGGMSIWTMFDPSIDLESLSKKAYQKGLLISDGNAHNYPNYKSHAIRLGFASSNDNELIRSIEILKTLL